eukprot:285017_1
MSNRIALGGITCTNATRIKNYKLMFGSKNVRNDNEDPAHCVGIQEAAQGCMQSNFWDRSTIMVPNINTQAVFGAQLFAYGSGSGSRVGIKIYYGPYDGSGTKKWIGPQKWNSNVYSNPLIGYHCSGWYSANDCINIGAPDGYIDTTIRYSIPSEGMNGDKITYYDQGDVSYPMSSGYIIGVQIISRGNRISLKLWKNAA